MLHRIAFIARKEFQYFWKDWESYLWTFAIPLLFMYFIGTVTGQMGGAGGQAARDPLTLIVAPGGGFLVDALVTRLEEQGYAVTRASSATEENSARRLSIPPRFTDTVLARTPQQLRFEPGDTGIAGDYDRYRVGRAVYTLLADLAVCEQEDTPWTAESLQAVATAPRNITLNVRPAGARKRVPTGYEQSVPGILLMFSLLVGLSNTSAALVIERLQGRLKRLACTPISRGEVFVGKWLARWACSFVQVVVGMICGTVLFGVQWGPHLFTVLLVLLCWCAVCASAGLLLGSLVRTQSQGIGISVLAANGLCALGGLWWPVEVTPDWMQRLAGMLPTGWAMRSLHQLTLFAAEPATVVPGLIGLTLVAAVLAMLGAKSFRFA